MHTPTLKIEHPNHEVHTFDLIETGIGFDTSEPLPCWLEDLMYEDMSDPYEEIEQALWDAQERGCACHCVGEWCISVDDAAE